MEENYKLAKWLSGEMTDSELKEFQSEPDYHLYEKIKKYSSELETASFDSQNMLNNILSIKKENRKVITFQPNWFMRIAAVLVICFGLLFTYTTFSTSKEYAENGNKTKFMLPDNSEVILNAGSEIEYKKWFWDNNRKLGLQGEAYFKVAKGKKFEVNTNLGKVTVLGTQFNVKARKERFDVTCFEGRVKVNYNDKEVILTKGQMVSFQDNEKIIHQATNENKPLWTKNEIGFEKENLSTIIDEIERQYNITIDGNKIKSEQLFTGKIPLNNIDVALQIISATYHLNYSKTTPTSYNLVEKR